MARRKKKNDRWIQKAIEREGRVRRYLRRKYGSKAFNKDGTIKMQYIDKAIADIKKKYKGRKLPKETRSLLMALYLAKRLKRM